MPWCDKEKVRPIILSQGPLHAQDHSMDLLVAPTIYTVILNWNGINDTRACLHSLEHVYASGQSFRSCNLKVICVDNGSENAEGDTLKQELPHVSVIQNGRNLGFAGGVNVGIRRALSQHDCDYILLLNNDVEIDGDFLSPLLLDVSENKRTIASPAILYLSTRRVQNLGGKINWWIGGTVNVGKGDLVDRCPRYSSPQFLSGCCWLAPAEAFREVGFLDEDYFAYGEDLDWCVRARRIGYTLKVNCGSIIFHRHSGSSAAGSSHKVFLIAKNNILFARKHLSPAGRCLYVFNSIWAGLVINLVKHKSLRCLPSFVQGVLEGVTQKIR